MRLPPRIALPVAEVIVLAAMGWFLTIAYFSPYTVFDDAFMFVRYAMNVASGHGWVWNRDGGPADGLTSPLWMPVVGLAYWLSGHPPTSPYPLAWASLVFSLLLPAHLYYRLKALLPESVAGLAWGGPLVLGFSSLSLAPIMVSGMETAFAAHVILAFVGAVLRAVPRPWEIAILGLLAILSRPDFGLLVLGGPALRFLLGPDGDEHSRRRLRQAVIALGTLLGIAGVAKLLYFGALLPLPFHVKGSLLSTPYEDLRGDVVLFWQSCWALYGRDALLLHLVVIVGLLGGAEARRVAWLWLPLLLTILYLSRTYQVMGTGHRYFMPNVPLLILLAASVWGPVLEQARFRFPAWHGLVVALVVAALGGWTQLAIPGLQLRQRVGPPSGVGTFSIGAAIGNLPAGTRVAATEVGVLGASALEAHVMDLSGLNDARFTNRFDAEVLFRESPDVITLVHGDYGGMVRRIRAHETFARFVPFQLSPDGLNVLRAEGDPHDLLVTLWVWRDSPRWSGILHAWGLEDDAVVTAEAEP